MQKLSWTVWGMIVLQGVAVFAEEAAFKQAVAESDHAGSLTKSQDVQCIVEDGIVFVLKGQTRTKISTPEKVLGILQTKNDLYVALGRQGAAVFDISDPAHPKQLRIIEAGSDEIVGFQLVDDEVWIRTISTKIVPEGTSMAASTPQADKASSSVKADSDMKAEKAVGRPIRVVEVARGKITLDVGSKDGVQVGDRFSVFRIVSVKGGKREQFKGSELAAVVEVVAVSESQCLATLWRGDRATVNDRVESKGPDHRASLVFPRHLTDLAEISITLRPTLNVAGPLGFGAINDLSFTYWGNGLFAGIRLAPLGFAIADNGNALVMNLGAEAGYDARAFAIGLGVGFNAVTFRDNAFSISQNVRLGARDGLNLTVRNLFSLRNHSEYDYDTQTTTESLGFEWGGLASRLNIPLSGRIALFFEGGGNEDYFFGDMGVEAWVIGNGDAGSLSISAAAGGAGIMVDSYNDDFDYYYYNGTAGDEEEHISIETIGPMVSLGLNYRFGFNKR